MKQDNRPLMVTIRCTTYNQEAYIRECLEGFVMQKTNFRFEAIVHDDASTDGTADIIREYEEKYPDIIKPIYETENQHSKHDGSLSRIMDEHTHGKYVAVCEGDDYWTDPLKLQKQYDFMEEHPECSMCFHANHILLPTGEKLLHKHRMIKTIYPPEDIILLDGVHLNTIFYRWKFLKEEGRPDFWKNCPIGDIPTKLYLASKGSIGFINDVMSVYRRSSIGGWSCKRRKLTLLQRTNHHKKIIRMYQQYDDYTKRKYHSQLQEKVNSLRIVIIKDWIMSITGARVIRNYLKKMKHCFF